MKIAIDQSTLAATLQRVGTAADPRDPARSCVLVTVTASEVVFTASNGELTIRETVPATPEGEGSLLVPAKLLTAIVKGAGPGDVVLSVDDSASDATNVAGGSFPLTVSTAGGNFTVPTRSVETFVLPEMPAGDVSTIAADIFSAAVRQVAPSASKDFGRPTLTGVLVAPTEGGLRLAATDTFRLAVKDVPSAGHILGDSGVVIPAANLLLALKALDSSGTLNVVHDTSRVGIASGHVSVVMSLISGEYPSFERVLPTAHTGTFTASGDALMVDVASSTLVADGSTHGVKLKLSATGASLHATSENGTFSGEGIGAFTGEDIELSFNGAYLADGINSLEAGEVLIETNSATDPVVLRNLDDPGFRYLLMPIKS